MAQDDVEIKMNSTESSRKEKIFSPVQRTISRDFKKRDISSEEKLAVKVPDHEGKFFEKEASRRDFFAAVIPASGKALTSFLRSLSTPESDPKNSKK